MQFHGRSEEQTIDLTADEVATELALVQHVVDGSQSPIAPPYSPLTPVWYVYIIYTYSNFNVIIIFCNICIIYNSTSLVDVIKHILKEEGNFSIDIWRSNLLADAFKEGKKKKFNPKKIVKV